MIRRSHAFVKILSALTAAGVGAASCTEDVALGPNSDDSSTGGEAGGDGSNTGGTVATGGSATGGDGGASGQGGDGGAGADGTGGSGTTGGDGGDGGSAGGDTPCLTGSSPSNETCLVSDSHAVFVAPSGDDEAAGTMTSPVATFGRALALARAAQKIVIACSGRYDEHVSMLPAARVYGGFDCENGWTYTPSERSRVAPSDHGYALEARNATSGVVIEDMEFVARDGTAPGESSVAGFISGFSVVTLTRVLFQAGRGAPGADGLLVPVTFPLASSLVGNDASGTMGGAAKTCSCPTGEGSIGGRGGNARIGGEAGEQGSATPTFDSRYGKGGAVGSCDLAEQRGADGFEGKGDASRPQTFGTLTSVGWIPTSGDDGYDGWPAQGGGGGSSSETAGGGSGGCGGCGGAGAKGGQAGGGSIALLVLESAVTVRDSELVASDGGDAGDASPVQEGQPGGPGGAAPATGCPGGAGGNGPRGGMAAGGTGGVSIGMLWLGQVTPIAQNVDFSLGTPGLGGVGSIVDEWSEDGNDGIAVDAIALDDIL